MDMQVVLPTRYAGWWPDAAATEHARLAEHRRRMFALIGEFRQAVKQPRGRREAVRVLKELLPCSDAYFAVIESLLDKISAAGASPHRDDHRRILDELKGTLELCSSSSAERAGTDLVHALDGLVIHEATIRLRAPENQFLIR
jgi:hemerythrin